MNKKIVLSFAVVMVIFGMIATFTIFNTIAEAPQVAEDKKHESAPEIPEQDVIMPESITSHVLFAGETFWGRRIEAAAEKSGDGTSFPFAKLVGFNREDYNAWFAHVECPVTNDVITQQQQEVDLVFNCKPEYLSEYSKWFDVVSLANNHTDNVDGLRGLNETRMHLEENDIQHYGHFDNAVLDELCEIVALPVTALYTDGALVDELFPVAMCGYHNVFKLPTEEELDVISAYSKYFFTIVTPQMGAEYTPVADQLKIDTYRAMVDRGADLVIASHPHWVQNSEVYKGKLIMYSIGNFMFDQEWSIDVKRGVAVDATFKLNESASTQLADWLNMGKRCTAFKDECLLLAEEQQLPKPMLDVTYDLVASEFSEGQAHPASKETLQALLERTNWPQTKAMLVQ